MPPDARIHLKQLLCQYVEEYLEDSNVCFHEVDLGGREPSNFSDKNSAETV